MVSFEPADAIDLFASMLGLPFEFAADPHRHAYRHFGLKRGSLLRIFGLRTVWRYIGLMLKGRKFQRAHTDDIRQLGGDFVIDAAGTVAYEYPSANPADRPSGEDVARAVERAARPE